MMTYQATEQETLAHICTKLAFIAEFRNLDVELQSLSERVMLASLVRVLARLDLENQGESTEWLKVGMSLGEFSRKVKL